jgi:anaerobic ribonucleoside-triphosphate reductase
MYIKTTYDQDFDDLYMHLKSKYPQRLFDADGIGKQTDMSAFSKNFFASSVTADASIDANANVDDVSVIAYETEINKPHLKLNSYYILWKELKRLYGLETANNVIEHQLTGDIYIHDAHGIGSGKPYSYYGGCCIIVKIDDVIKFLTFEEFYNLMAETLPIIDAGNDTFEIKTPNVLILDEGNVWTPVYKVLKHKSHTNMVRIGTSCGKDTLVTSDHPVITEKKVRPASDVSGRDVLKNWDITYDFIEESRDNTKLHSTFEYTTPDLAKNVIPQNILFVNKDVVRQYLAFVFDTFGRYTDAGAVIIDTLGYGDLHKIAELVRMMGSGLAEINISDHPKRKPYKLTCRITDKMIITYSTICRKAAQKGNTNGRKSNWGKNGAKVTRKFEMDAPEYVYDITTASGQFYCQGLIQHNCFNYSTYDIMLNGLPMVKKIKSVPPKYLYSFKSQLEQFVVIASNSTLGATGLADLLVVMSYYVKNILKTKSDAHFHFRDEKDCWAYIKENLVSFIYTINQPMRANQSPFTNTSIYDANFLNKLCDDYIFPDGSSPDREIVQKLQDLYLTVMNEELERTPVTFPVTTGCFSIDENNNILDEEFLDFIARHVQKWGFINIYAGASSTLSSCCFDANQKVLIKNSNGVILDTIKNVVEGEYDTYRRNLTVFHNGSWVQAKPIKVPYDNTMYKITTANNKELYVTDNHIHATYNGDKATNELSVDDYILFNNMALNAIPERDMKLTYNQGFLIGLYAGDGSKYKRKDCESYSITFSLNENKIKHLDKISNALNDWGIDKNIHINTYNNLVSATVYSKELYDIISQYIHGGYAQEKEFDLNVLLQSYDFRKGICDGWHCADGSNGNRIYSTSKKLIETGEIIFNSIGVVTTISSLDRMGDVEINGGIYTRNYPSLCIRWYTPNNKRSMKNIYKIKNNSMYFKIQSIEKYDYNGEYVYCFEVNNQEEPYFTLPNGVITHNCRLRSEQKSEYFNSFGSGSSKIGSLGVCSINLPRIAIKSNGDENKFFEMLAYFVGVAAKVNNAKRHIIQKRINNGNEPLYTLGFMDISKQYSTFGVNGFHEMLQVLGYDILTDEGSDFGVKVIKFINNENKKYEKQYNAPHNTEQVPAENMSIKMVEKDRIMGYDLGCDLYSNQFIPLITNADMLDRIRLQGKFDKHFSGGAICHLNVDTRIDDIEQIKSLIRICVKMGVVYFAINYVLQQCEDGHMTVGNREICPICGKNIENTYTRPVGFLTNVKNWHVVRREKDFPNRQFYNNINIGDVNN